ncbi:MAG: 50S ribosomal protein L13 [Candidatus Shikimatogenerans sp. AspAUS03]|uniref:Large ribosomal subunit protein uL13 n=1 Tax=Candidatus Shikimatogenerans sp. AspAUS03 TaxID=3158563 RepID=A0AAU7QSF6_9FLAO
MQENSCKTKFYNNYKKKWYLINCKKKVLGRVSTIAAKILIGKYNIFYTPNFLSGDNVVLYNINKIILKKKKKIYIYYTGYPGGKKQKDFKHWLKTNPKKIFLHSILGMIKNNRLKKNIKKNLYLYKKKKEIILKNINFIKLKF